MKLILSNHHSTANMLLYVSMRPAVSTVTRQQSQPEFANLIFKTLCPSQLGFLQASTTEVLKNTTESGVRLCMAFDAGTSFTCLWFYN